MTLPTLDEQIESPLSCQNASEELAKETPPYKIRKKVGPPLFKNHVEMDCEGKLHKCLWRDIAWSAAGYIANVADIDPIGSRTAFNKQVFIKIIMQRAAIIIIVIIIMLLIMFW